MPILFEKLSLINLDTLFWFCALAGSGMFIIQILLSLLGSDHHEDLDGGDTESIKIKWLSKQALSGFFMVFGWLALACHHELGLRLPFSLAIALAAGVLTILITGFIFKFAKLLRSPGTVFNLDDAIGKEAIVYQSIKKNRKGKISLSLNDMTHEIDAVSLTEEDLSSFISVRIVKKADDKTVAVVPVKK